MATFVYQCSACSAVTEDEYPVGTARRVKKCHCGRPARLVIGAGVNLSASCTPNKSGDVLAARRREHRFEKDGPAYLRMRTRGLQPEQIDGSADLENRVGDQDDIDYRRAIQVAETVGGGKERVVEAVESIEVTHG